MTVSAWPTTSGSRTFIRPSRSPPAHAAMNRSVTRRSSSDSSSKRAGPVSSSIRRRARLASCLHAAAERPTIGPMSSTEKPKTACTTKAARPAGEAIATGKEETAAGSVTCGVDVTPRDATPSLMAMRRSPTSRPVIEVRGLAKTYPGGVEAVKGIDFDVDAGEVFGLLGPNGAGKSTTIGMLTTTVAPTGGRAPLAGYDVATQPLQARSVSSGAFPEAVGDGSISGS